MFEKKKIMKEDANPGTFIRQLVRGVINILRLIEILNLIKGKKLNTKEYQFDSLKALVEIILD